ncbi:MAG: hypothetical protein ACRC9X_02660, partial [Bacteroidales bacterium]
MMRKCFAVVVFAVFPVFLFGQNIAEADALFSAGKYDAALKKYKGVIDANARGRVKAIEQLAECNRLLGNLRESYRWYEMALQNPNASHKAMFSYAKALRDGGDYKRAKEQMLKYMKVAPIDDRPKVFISNIDQVVLWKSEPASSNGAVVASLSSLNSPYGETAVALSAKNAVVVTSTRDAKYSPAKPVKSIKHIAPKMWFAMIDWSQKDPQFGAMAPFLPVQKVGVTSPIHQSSVAFSADGNFMVFAQSDVGAKDASQYLYLYSSSKNAGQWSSPEKLSFNQSEYVFKDPSLSADGKTLYFSSNIPSGKGGFDIYMSTFENGVWSTPHNLDAINTVEDEVTPSIYNNVLYFSSDGHPTFGGLDVFSSIYSNGAWQQPVNLREPVNSTSDDMSFVPFSWSSALFVSLRNNRLASVFSFAGVLEGIETTGVSVPVVTQVAVAPKEDEAAESVVASVLPRFSASSSSSNARVAEKQTGKSSFADVESSSAGKVEQVAPAKPTFASSGFASRSTAGKVSPESVSSSSSNPTSASSSTPTVSATSVSSSDKPAAFGSSGFASRRSTVGTASSESVASSSSGSTPASSSTPAVSATSVSSSDKPAAFGSSGFASRRPTAGAASSESVASISSGSTPASSSTPAVSATSVS